MTSTDYDCCNDRNHGENCGTKYIELQQITLRRKIHGFPVYATKILVTAPSLSIFVMLPHDQYR